MTGVGVGCSLVLTILSPPSSIVDASDIDTSPRLQVLTLTASELQLIAAIPPPATSGNLTLILKPAVASPGFSDEELQVQTTLEIDALTPAVRKLHPTEVLSTGGQKVKVDLSGFPVFAASSDLIVTLRGTGTG
ncbi:hypothetical protein T484DRAFT_1817084 [Baffinella frigidus]|nr:hypothetical protein T484DRAFT_1817084 [Cryptophyta sp. CCMP2293]